MNKHEVPIFDAARYPRTYRLSPGARRLLFPMGILILALGAGAALFSGIFSSESARARIFEGTLGTLLAGLGLYIALSARMYRVVLEADCIKTFGVLRQRQLDRTNIAGRRHFVSKAGSARWILVPERGFGGKLELSMLLQPDKDFSAWMLSLPDLDQSKKDTEERAIADGVSVLEQRGYNERAQQKIRTIATWLNPAVIGLGVAMYFLPDPHHVLVWVACVTPWLAIAAVAKYQPIYRIAGPRSSRISDLSLPVFMPGLFLALTALTSMSTVYWQSALSVMLLVTLILIGAALYADPWLRKHLGAASLFALLCCGYGYGAGLEANALLDHSVPESFSVRVLSKRIDHGKHTTYDLGVPAWGPKQAGDEIMVPSARYWNTKVGDPVCILLRPGAVDVAWYTLTSCEQ